LGKTDAAQPSYMPQLDALRFFAVLGVMVAHNWHPRRLPWIFGDLDWAGLGVRLFFVLSGFLITGILIGCRNTADRTGVSLMFFIRRFYIRRILRIFPIYYLVVFIALAVNLEPAREIWGWLLTYTTNVYITLHNEWIGRLGHFWSLAVEEQFYFIWPWIVLMSPRKRVLPILLFFIALAPVYRFYAYMNFPFDIGAMDFKAATFLFGNIDSLAIGALLALLWNSRIPKEKLRGYLTRLVLPTGVIIYMASLILYHYRIQPLVFFVFGDLAAALMFAWLIGAAALGFRNIPGKLLELPALVYLGKISYGIYVYHYLVPLMLVPILAWFGYELVIPGRLNFLLSSVLTIAIASLSWHLFEFPINGLKRYFEYLPKPAAEALHPQFSGNPE
jgi:peptidoglycan/LPS O-acetylase OafA/YrhL